MLGAFSNRPCSGRRSAQPPSFEASSSIWESRSASAIDPGDSEDVRCAGCAEWHTGGDDHALARLSDLLTMGDPHRLLHHIAKAFYVSGVHAVGTPQNRKPSSGSKLRGEHQDWGLGAFSAAACQVAALVGASAIVSYTTSGATALRAARERPEAPILVLTSNLGTARRLAILWGAHCVHTSDVKNFGDMVQKAVRIAHSEGIAQPGQRVVITAGIPFGTPGATNVLRIAWVDR